MYIKHHVLCLTHRRYWTKGNCCCFGHRDTGKVEGKTNYTPKIDKYCPGEIIYESGLEGYCFRYLFLITNYTKTYWLKIPILFCSWFCWSRIQEGLISNQCGANWGSWGRSIHFQEVFSLVWYLSVLWPLPLFTWHLIFWKAQAHGEAWKGASWPWGLSFSQAWQS